MLTLTDTKVLFLRGLSKRTRRAAAWGWLLALLVALLLLSTQQLRTTKAAQEQLFAPCPEFLVWFGVQSCSIPCAPHWNQRSPTLPSARMERAISRKQKFLANIQLLSFTPQMCRQSAQYCAHVPYERDELLPFENTLVSDSHVHESDFYKEKQGTQKSFWRCKHNSAVSTETLRFCHTLEYLSAHTPLSSSLLPAQSTTAWDTLKYSSSTDMQIHVGRRAKPEWRG